MKKALAFVLTIAMFSSLLCGCTQSTPAVVKDILLREEPAETEPAVIMEIRPNKNAEDWPAGADPDTAKPAPTEAEKEATEPTESTKENTSKPVQSEPSVHTHKYTDKVYSPTCTEKGYTLYQCTCGDSYTDNKTNALGHDYKAKVIAPTQNAKGYTEHTCTRCNNSYRDTYTDKLPAAHSHIYCGEIIAPTCTKAGYMIHRCGCGDSYTEIRGNAQGHDYKATVIAPTQNAKGYTEYACTRCNDSYRDTYTEKLPAVHTHAYNSEVVAPTCTEKGYTIHRCACGDSYSDTYTDALYHYYVYLPVPSTTTEQGYDLVTCKRCGDTYKENFLDPIEENHTHNFVPTVIEPTCTISGYTSFKCSCGQSYSDNDVEALGHDYKATVIAPAENSEGYTEHICTRCGDSYRDEYTHVHIYFSQTVAPTCMEAGYTEYFCPCAASYTEDVVPALGHDYKAVVIAPTQESEGYTDHTCTRCSDSYRDTYTDKLPAVHIHSFNQEEKQEPTCCENGYWNLLCSCGEKQEHVLPADPEKHNYETTGENAAYRLVACTVCGHTAQQAKTDDIYALINTQREMNGLNPITVYSEAQPAADLRAQEIKTLFSHMRPNMSMCFTVTEELGISGFFANENIGVGYVDNAAMVEGWMNSPGHRANLLDDSINAMTVSRNGGYWVFMGFII